MLLRRDLHQMRSVLIQWHLAPEHSDGAVSARMQDAADDFGPEDAVLTALSTAYHRAIGMADSALLLGDGGIFGVALTALEGVVSNAASIGNIPAWVGCHSHDPYRARPVVPKPPYHVAIQSSAGGACAMERIAPRLHRTAGNQTPPSMELWPSQLTAAARSTDPDDDLVIALPTSAGKTRIAELCVLRTLADGRRAVYVTPLRALSAQVERVLGRTFVPLDASVTSLYGASGATSSDVNTLATASIVVATPEKLDFALRQDPDVLNDVGLIVFDEGHMIGLGSREIRYEVLIQRLLRRPDATARRIVCQRCSIRLIRISLTLAIGFAAMQRATSFMSNGDRRASASRHWTGLNAPARRGLVFSVPNGLLYRASSRACQRTAGAGKRFHITTRNSASPPRTRSLGTVTRCWCIRSGGPTRGRMQRPCSRSTRCPRGSSLTTSHSEVSARLGTRHRSQAASRFSCRRTVPGCLAPSVRCATGTGGHATRALSARIAPSRAGDDSSSSPRRSASTSSTTARLCPGPWSLANRASTSLTWMRWLTPRGRTRPSPPSTTQKSGNRISSHVGPATESLMSSGPSFRDAIVFKGGTSLSKVFGVINRFGATAVRACSRGGDRRTKVTARTGARRLWILQIRLLRPLVGDRGRLRGDVALAQVIRPEGPRSARAVRHGRRG